MTIINAVIDTNETNSVTVTISPATIINCTISSSVRGKSTYEIWLEAGHVGTVEDFLNWIAGSNTIARKYSTVLTALDTTYIVNHNLSTRDAVVSIRSNTEPYNRLDYLVDYTTENSITVTFESALQLDSTVTVVG